MSIDKLIMKFSIRENVPVQVDEVIAGLRDLGVTDTIEFYDSSNDADILKGKIRHAKRTNGSASQVVAEIYAAKSLSTTEKRLVQTKELMHVLDPTFFHVNTFQQVEDLIDKIAISEDLQDPEADGAHANLDHLAKWYAVAVLFPLAARDAFMVPYKEGKIDLKYIADVVDIPLKYAAAAMSDQWTSLYRRLMTPRRKAGPCRVSPLDDTDAPIEVHSVPIGTDPYTYAKNLIQRQGGIQIKRMMIESDGHRQTWTHTEIFAIVDKRE